VVGLNDVLMNNIYVSKPVLVESNNERNFNPKIIGAVDDDEVDVQYPKLDISTRDQSGSVPPVSANATYLTKEGINNTNTNINKPNESFVNGTSVPAWNGNVPGINNNNNNNTNQQSNTKQNNVPFINVVPFAKSLQFEQQQQMEKQVCKYFLEGHCARGEKCRFAHPGASYVCFVRSHSLYFVFYVLLLRYCSNS
jgi:hypothetical protein